MANSPELAPDLHLARQVDRERVALLFARAPVALAAVVINSAVLTWLLWGLLPTSLLVGWMTALWAITSVRAGLLLLFQRRAHQLPMRRWEGMFALGALANGLAWGIGATAFMGTELVYSVAVLFVVGGMVAGASSSNATSMRSFAAFTVPAAAPVLAELLSAGSVVELVLGVTSAIFVVAMSVMAWQGGRVFVDGIRLRLHNGVLSRELARRTRERAVRLQALLDHAGVITLVTEPDTSCVVDASKNAEALFGLHHDEIVGHSLVGTAGIDVIDTPESWDRMVSAARAGEYTVTATMTDRRSGAGRDARRHVDLTATVQAVGEQLYVLVVLRDVTERLELEAQLHRSNHLASLGMLSAGVAHEINNPLMHLLADLEYLRSGIGGLTDPTAPVLGATADEALDAAARIQRTVSSLLLTSRVANDTAATTDVRAIAEACLQVAHNEIRHRAAAEVISHDPVRNVAAQPLRVYQALLQLVLHAAHAIDEGDAASNRITIEIQDAGADVEIRVTDTGRGMAPELVQRVFDPFFASGAGGRSAGLGLYVCHGVVVALGGTITATSTPGRGSTFLVRLPAAPRPEPIPEPDVARAADLLQILVVDDEILVARVIARMLRRHHVTVETQATDALGRIEAGERFDAIVCDVMMPTLPGPQLHAAVARLDPEQARRMVFVTGGAFTGVARQFLEDVPNPALDKPFSVDDLESALAMLVRDAS